MYGLGHLRLGGRAPQGDELVNALAREIVSGNQRAFAYALAHYDTFNSDEAVAATFDDVRAKLRAEPAE